MSIQQIQKLVEEGESLQLITRVFTEIASAKLKRIRKGIEQNRAFFYDLTNMYSLVNMLSLKQGAKTKPRNPRTAVILLTSNYRFYGKVTNPLIEYFIKQTEDKDVDRLIVGKTAHSYLETIHYSKPYKQFIFKKDIPDIDEVMDLTSQIKNHTKVLVFHAQMKSVLIQIPVAKEITQSIDPQMYTNKVSGAQNLLNQFDYILEPDLGLMLQFFDAQIKGLLLEQAFLESELARTASRVISMDSAQNGAKNYLKSVKNELKTERKNITNARIIEISSILNIARKVNR